MEIGPKELEDMDRRNKLGIIALVSILIGAVFWLILSVVGLTYWMKANRIEKALETYRKASKPKEDKEG